MSHAIGIDFGGTTIKSGLVKDGRIVEFGSLLDTQQCGGPGEIVDGMARVIAELRALAPDVISVGVGLPGLVDSVNGFVHELTNVPGWYDVSLRQLLEERTGLPVTIENDANAMAYGEFKYGAARNATHVICITLGTGVGGALILDGRLYRGAQLGAGEIGHLSIDYRGIPGPYGNFGGLEEYVGNQQIAARAAARYREAGRAVSDDDCQPKALSTAAAAGDAIAQQLWAEIGDEIGAALASVIWVLNPDAIVIGGGIAYAGERLFDPIRRSVNSRTSKVFHEKLQIIPAALGNEAGIIGNAVLSLEYAETLRAAG